MKKMLMVLIFHPEGSQSNLRIGSITTLKCTQLCGGTWQLFNSPEQNYTTAGCGKRDGYGSNTNWHLRI